MSKEIKQRIDELCQQLEEVLTPGMFTLNPEVTKINNEIRALQAQCEHHYVEGQCEFCYHLEGVNE